MKPCDDIDYINKIQSGGGGTIYKYINEQKIFAFKIFKTQQDQSLTLPPLSNFAVKIYRTHYHNKGVIQIMELCDGDIKSTNTLFSIFHLLLFSLFLYKYNLSHGDIKPGNFLVKNNIIKLSDFDGAIQRCKKPRFGFYTNGFRPKKL